MKKYLYGLVGHFNIGPDVTRVGVATFSSNARVEFHLDEFDNKRAVQNAISALSYRYGNTNIAAGLRLVRSGMFAGSRGDRHSAADYRM